MGDDNNRYYVRGKSFSQAEAKKGNQAIWATLFNLAPNEQGKDPSDILEEAMNDILSQNCTSFLPHPLSGHTSEITVPIKILKERLFKSINGAFGVFFATTDSLRNVLKC